ncbi:hypothetical protein ACIPW9_36230 [Streptomyces sp. NPDC090052]|uniref:hypothetical protein n=1 Tax=Streptomyces sp. NPDC090052 TaxID=3365931 RepID=UPI0038124B12
MTQQTPTAWPENVLARYLTRGDATVDITEIDRNERGGGVYQTVASCAGCLKEERHQWEDGFYDFNSQFHPLSRDEAIQRSETKARNWAQAHAETCRAMPKPTT